MARINRQALASWLFLGLLASGALVLGFLQYRWLGEVSAAERERLRTTLQTTLARVAEDFDARIATAASAVVPGPGTADTAVRERQWAANFARVKSSADGPLIRALYLARPVEDGVSLRRLSDARGVFEDAEWPANLGDVRERLLQRRSGMRPGPGAPPAEPFIEIPYFAPPSDGPPRGPVEWALIEVDQNYLATKLLPELIERQLGAGALQDYDFRVATRTSEEKVVYASSESARAGFSRPDATVDLFHGGRRLPRFAGGRGGPPPGEEPRPEMDRPRPPTFDPPRRQGDEPTRAPGEFRGGRPEPGRFGPGPRARWVLEARSRAGSLESLVDKARRRNLFVITALLALVVAAGAALVRYARRAHQLADMQLEFVAGVSHELRTPLAVVRTAGYNLSHAAVPDAERVQQYGALIQTEAEKLSGIVEEVLGFAKAQSGRVIGAVAPVPVDRLIDDAVADSHTTVERTIEPGLPPVLADEHALKHAMQNLLSNAVKYGDGWIGVSARAVGPRVEIAVSDRGPGIPADELAQIFEPFYRGRQAVSDQIHGTGLGLSLVKRIVEAHNGTISVRSKDGNGAEFVISVPAAGQAADSAG